MEVVHDTHTPHSGQDMGTLEMQGHVLSSEEPHLVHLLVKMCTIMQFQIVACMTISLTTLNRVLRLHIFWLPCYGCTSMYNILFKVKTFSRFAIWQIWQVLILAFLHLCTASIMFAGTK